MKSACFFSEDLLAIGIGTLCLLACLAINVAFGHADTKTDDNGEITTKWVGPLKNRLAKPGKWEQSVSDAFVVRKKKPIEKEQVEKEQEAGISLLPGIAIAGGVIVLLLCAATRVLPGARDVLAEDNEDRPDQSAVAGDANADIDPADARPDALLRFLPAILVLFGLAFLAYVMAGQKLVRAYNLEYALWALLIGLIISNTVGTPRWLRPAVRTELLIKCGLVMLGAGILFAKLLVLGVPGILIAWVVTPIVLISTFWFGQKVLKISSPSLNMVISADMSVCGVSAAVATSAACRAKKEELSLAIGLSLCFTAIMMLVMPAIIRGTGMNPIVGGAWMGGTIDATGAVTAAGDLVSESAGKVALTIKLIQNILIGVFSVGIAAYWASRYTSDSDDPSNDSESSQPKRSAIGEIWYRFPKFVLGFLAASIVFSI
ncbi:MAG: putative sulfate exporter family transporter, partial [Planctomycetota bacterium]